MHCFGCQYASPAQILYQKWKKKVEITDFLCKLCIFFYFYIRQITNFCKYVLKIADNAFYNRRGFIESWSGYSQHIFFFFFFFFFFQALFDPKHIKTGGAS